PLVPLVPDGSATFPSIGEDKANMIRWRAVALRTCSLSFTGPSRVRHSVEVIAGSIYEAAAVGVSALKNSGWVDAIAPGTELEVLVIDGQATAAAPRGHLLEIGWAQVRNTVTHPHACLITLPDGEQIPPAVSRITGISEHMMRSAVDARHAWRELSDQAASLT